jgi:hypothetical protein
MIFIMINHSRLSEMKTTIFLCRIISMPITGCNERHADSTTHEHDSTAQKTEETGRQSETSLNLNEVKKWKLDEPTRTNINATKEIFEKGSERNRAGLGDPGWPASASGK